MQKKTILRLGLVGVVATASSASTLAIGCGSSSSGGGEAADSSTPDGTGFTDSATDSPSTMHDSAGDTEAATPPVHAKVLFVNAAGDFPGVRVCIGVDSPAMLLSGIYPLPNSLTTGSPLRYPEILPGTGGPLPDITDLQNLELTVFLINAGKIAGNTASTANELDCPTLIGMGGQGSDAGVTDGGAPLVKGVDYFQLPMAIPMNTFKHGNVYLVALEGCGPGDSTGVEAELRCGSTYSASTGNLNLEIYQLDNTTPATSTTMNVQVLHASQAWSSLLAAGPPPSAYGQPFASTFSFFDTAADAGGPALASDLNFGSPVTPTPAAAQTINPADYASLGVVLTDTAPDGGPLAFPNPADPDGGPVLTDVSYPPFPFEIIQALSGYATAADGGPADPLYVPGGNFTLVWLGDPTLPEFINPNTGMQAVDGGPSTFNTGYIHYLMFPNNPAVPSQ